MIIQGSENSKISIFENLKIPTFEYVETWESQNLNSKIRIIKNLQIQIFGNLTVF